MTNVVTAWRVGAGVVLSVDVFDTFKNRPPTAATKKNDVALVTAPERQF